MLSGRKHEAAERGKRQRRMRGQKAGDAIPCPEEIHYRPRWTLPERADHEPADTEDGGEVYQSDGVGQDRAVRQRASVPEMRVWTPNPAYIPPSPQGITAFLVQVRAAEQIPQDRASRQHAASSGRIRIRKRCAASERERKIDLSMTDAARNLTPPALSA